MELFLCPSCHLALWEPVTVSCGHSFCRRCLTGESPSQCCVCGDEFFLLGSRTVQCNVLLGDLLEKCVDKGTRVARLKGALTALLRIGDCKGALQALQKGVGFAPDDHELRMCRSEVHISLQQYPEALKDLEMLCVQEPGECEVFFRKGKVLLAMGRKSEALKQFQHCLTLNSRFFAAQYEIEKDLKDRQDVWQEETVSSQNLASLSLPECLWKKSISGVSAKKEEVVPNLFITGDRSTLDNYTETRGGVFCRGMSLPPEPLLRLLSCRYHAAAAAQCHADGEPQPWRPPESTKDTEKGAKAGTPGAKSTQDIKSHLSTSDLECSLCIRMFFEPVTTPCGHTFCKECVERSLDHRPNCPLCKQSLREYLKARKYSTTVVLEELMSTIFPSQLADRKQIHQTEMAELSNFADYGCMLEIQKIDFLPDGRSFVNTTGKRRFRVLRRGHKDGYNTADIEYLEDEKVEGEELTELQNLHDCTYDLTQRFYENGYMTFRRSLMHYGPLPEKEEDIQASPDGPAWCWWLILTLSLDVTRKLAIFSDTSLKSRLTQLKNILNMILESSEFSS
ncbi:LON peptidase N-terminal domain and RING finger protein 1-like isoform X2 [Paroedura picta]|uniref:LON peptidase N-terminal domain and RING finger protein 1-like isoform X2 n=1 Tax=Paroedura picta TaxID=143630 RepID=UPI004055D9F5